jgi:hypothetical protein
VIASRLLEGNRTVPPNLYSENVNVRYHMEAVGIEERRLLMGF